MVVQLDEIMQRLQSGELGLDETIKEYELAAKLVKEMEQYLKTAENKIKKIKSNFELDA